MAERVRITDVSPRDGLQNEPGVIPTADKVRLVQLLCKTGVDEVEVSSFVSAKWVPQLGDAAAVFEGILASVPQRQGGWGVRPPMLSALVPNEKGLDAALVVNSKADTQLVDKVSVFTAASETFSKRNTNASIAETLDRFRPVIRRATDAGLEVRGYISCIVACPFEGPIDPASVAYVAGQLTALGVHEIDFGDTIGAATPESISNVLRETAGAILGSTPTDRWVPRVTLHLHDTNGRAADCVRTALDLGVYSFDGSVAGLGGCPYASTPGNRAPGNISTELLVRTVEAAGYETGVDHDALREAAAFASSIVARSRAAAP